MKQLLAIGSACLFGLYVLSLGNHPAESRDAQPETAKGVVYHDVNGNRVFDAGEPTLPGVKVSNGETIVETNADGAYQLPVDGDTNLFVIKPRGWRTPLNKNNLPQFYYIHKPHGSPDLKFGGVAATGPLPESIDFPLYPQDEPDTFQALMFGDPQPRNQQEVDYITHDVVEELIGKTDASFGVTLGDITFDDLSLFEPQARAIALLGIPWYNVIGNHDINYDAAHDGHSDETFERVFGPSYYSFDYGPVHFLVLDDIEWLVESNGKGRYRGGLGPQQMAFIRNDLARIPEDQLVVLMMHIPLMDVEDRHDLYRLIEQRPFSMSISAHRHVHQHFFIDDKDGWRGPQPHHHVVNVTVSGSWWSGAPDERGIPHTIMADGAPNGYSVISFDGHEYSIEFFAAGRSPEYQMEIHAPEVVSAADLENTVIYANVFNGSERTQVSLQVKSEGGAPAAAMEKANEADPGFVAVSELENSIENKTWRNLPKPAKSTHLWKAQLPSGLAPGVHLIEVRATDANGKEHVGRRAIRVK